MAASDDTDVEDLLLIAAIVAIGVQILRFAQSSGTFSFPGSAPQGTAFSGIFAAVPMTVSPSGRAFIQSNEGFSLQASGDGSARKIYWGHDITATDPPIVGTMAQAEQFFNNDIATVEAAINQNVTVALSQDQFDALADLIYNIGVGAFEGSTLLQQLNQGDYAGAAQQILAWNRSGGSVNPGLVNRRAADNARFTSTG